MKLLLDTHTLIWADSDPGKLSAAAAAAIRDPANEVLISVASVWEMVIKAQIGKLALRLPLADIIAEQQANGMSILPATLPHVFAVETLPMHHRDPFDRLLVAQAMIEGAALVTTDPLLAPYPVTLFW
ncbi:MAG: type II toxin-antitoxin system VapC family toxin [Gemmataceae bacterium]|nr:type II toxin-antitoxin system VapC family toxin [Gemmataceae bacterium]